MTGEPVGERTTRQSLAITTTAFGLGLATLVLVSANLITMLAVAPRAGAAPVAYQNPVSPLDAPDPDIVFVNGEYYAFTTGGAYGHIQEFTSSDLVNWTPRPNPGALVSEPGWVNPGLEWAPSVGQFANTWVMLYATFDEWLDAECVTEATAPAVGGPYVNDAQGPLLCQPLLGAGGILYGGDIDPDLFVSNGVPYLLWKANPAGFTTQAALWSEQLSPDGLSLAPGSSPNELLEQDQSWESTIENPDMVEENGVNYLFYSGGNWWDSTVHRGVRRLCRGRRPLRHAHRHPRVVLLGVRWSARAASGPSPTLRGNGGWPTPGGPWARWVPDGRARCGSIRSVSPTVLRGVRPRRWCSGRVRPPSPWRRRVRHSIRPPAIRWWRRTAGSSASGTRPFSVPVPNPP